MHFSSEKSSVLLNHTLFSKRPVLIYLHARELFMFLFSSAEFLQNYVFLQINHRGSPSECQTVWIQIKIDVLWSSSWFKLFAKGYWQTTKFSTGMQRAITGKYLSVQYIVSYR